MLLLAATALSCVSCSLFDTGRPQRQVNPDTELPQLVQAWTDARRNERERGSQFLASEEIRHRVERLAFENPRHIPTLMACAAIEFESGRPEKATDYIDDVFQLQPAHPEAAILRSRIALSRGNTQFARKLLETQIRFVPDHAELRSALAGVAFLEKDYEGARTALEAARRLGAEEWRIAYNQGLVEESAGNSSEAARQYLLCLELNPGYAPAQSRLNGLQ